MTTVAKALLIPLAAALATYYNQYNGGATDSGQIAKGISYVGGFYSAYLYASTPEYIVGHDLGKNLHMIGKIFTLIQVKVTKLLADYAIPGLFEATELIAPCGGTDHGHDHYGTLT